MSAFTFPAPTSSISISARCNREKPVREKPVGESTYAVARSLSAFAATVVSLPLATPHCWSRAARSDALLLEGSSHSIAARGSNAPFRFTCFRMLAVNRRVSDRCAGHGRVRSRVVVAEEDEVRGSRRRPDTSCSARPTSTNCLIFRRTRSSR